MHQGLKLASVFGAWLAFVAAAPAAQQSAQQIFQTASPSVVLLVMEDAQGRAVSLGTGFFVRPGVIATELHLLAGASRGHFKHIGRDERLPLAGVLASDRERDLLLLSAPKAKAAALPLSERAVAVGDTVYTIGNPRGFEGTLSQGIVSGIRQSENQTLLQVTTPLSPGSSGSPVLDTEGQVVGIAIGTHAGQNLNFAVPVAELRALLAKIGPVKPLAAPPEAVTPPVPARAEGVVGALFTWERYSARERYYSFSLQNKLAAPVTRVYYIVAFYDRAGEPIHVDKGRYDDTIHPGLAQRVTGALDVYTSDLVDRAEIKVIGYELAR
jgi:hypothetical protein